MLKVGLLGAGRIGAVHAKAITSHPGSRLAAVSDVNFEAAAKLAASFGAEAQSNEAILADASIDAVLIASSTNTHSDLIEAATQAGNATATIALSRFSTSITPTGSTISSASRRPRRCAGISRIWKRRRRRSTRLRRLAIDCSP